MNNNFVKEILKNYMVFNTLDVKLQYKMHYLEARYMYTLNVINFLQSYLMCP